MSRAIPEPYPRLKVALLPASSSIVAYRYNDEPYFRLTHSSAGSWSSAYLDQASSQIHRHALDSAQYRSLGICDPREFELGLPAYFYVREAAVAAIRREAAAMGTRHRVDGGVRLSVLTVHAPSHAARMTDWVLSGIHPSLPEATHSELYSGLMHRLESEFSVSYLQYAYGVGFGAYCPAEMHLWPVTDLESLQLRNHIEGARLITRPEFVRELSGLDDFSARGSGTGDWHVMRSFLWENRKSLVAEWVKNPSLGVDDSSPLLWRICNVWASFVATSSARPDSDMHLKSAVKEMTDVLNSVPMMQRDFDDRGHPRPLPQAFGVSPRGAEYLVCEWMRYLGVLDAAVTQQSADGGIDVTSGEYVAQVKHYAGAVSGPEIQQLVGAAFSLKKRGLFFTSGRYTPAAVKAALSAGIPLFHYSAEDGTLQGVNADAQRLINGPVQHSRAHESNAVRDIE